MREVVGDCGHEPMIDGCLSYYRGDSPDERAASDCDDLDAAEARMARIAAMIGPVLSCEAHDQVGCDGAGCSSVQPMNDLAEQKTPAPAPKAKRERGWAYEVQGPRSP